MKERILIILPLSILLLIGFNRVKPVTDDTKASIIKRFWILKTHTERKFDFLICGDSRTYRGISPTEMRSVLPNFSIFNLGYSSGSYSSFMLTKMESKLDMGASQKIILLGITPYSLTPKASLDGQIKQELDRKKEEIFESIYLQPWKLFFEPVEIRWRIDSLAKFKPKYIQKYYDDGWVASDKIPPNPKEALDEYVKDFNNNQVSEEIIDHLMGQVKEWTSRGIQVFGVRPPTTIEMLKLEKELSNFDEDKFVLKFKQAGGIWLEVSASRYASYDGSHLDVSSAKEFSRDLATKVGLSLKYQ